MDSRGSPPRPSMVAEMANILLAERCTQTVGVNWVYNYVNRHDKLKTVFSRRYDYQRAKCEDPKVIGEWFDLVQRTIMDKGIASEDIYNFDETGSAMGLIATAKVITRAEYYGRRSVKQPGNREWVTSIECIGADGFKLPPCLIFKSKTYHEAWYEEKAIGPDWRIEISDNGWTTDAIGFRWLRDHFIPCTTSRTKGKYRLLILDGHGSHLTPQFDKLCSKHDIIPICMPPHSSHLLQPLDVGCFANLKRAYSGLIELKARCNINYIDKLDFLATYPDARRIAYNSETIQSAFAATGLVPFDPPRVISKLNIRLHTPTPTGSRSSTWSPTTPLNAKQLHQQASSVKALLKYRSLSPPSPTKKAINQLIKGCQLAMHSAAILAKENHDLRAANEVQKQKRNRSTRRILRTDGLTIQEARDLINSPNQAIEASNSTPAEPPPPASTPSSSRAPPRCTNCFQIGHRRTQCPNR
ncbi:suppressor protein sef1 [Aspergillus fumigatus]